VTRSDGQQKCEAVLRPAREERYGTKSARPEGKTSRLDKWLFCARLCRTRDAAQAVIIAGKVRRNGARVEKPGQAVRPGDVLTLAVGGKVRVVRVLAMAEKRRPVADAQTLYDTITD
jgi:ribosome-associated heat shock protein Hsp15